MITPEKPELRKLRLTDTAAANSLTEPPQTEPAMVEDSLVRVTSAEGTVESRATRLAWKRRDVLSLSGLDDGAHLTRTNLSHSIRLK